MKICTFPSVPSHGVDGCLEDKDNDKVDTIEQKVFFLSKLQCINYVKRVIEFLYDIAFCRSLMI